MPFTPLTIGSAVAPNRIVRSATYEGMGDAEGRPGPELGKLYADLAAGGVGTIVTGFAYVSRAGRAMHPRQCGIDDDARIREWENVVHTVRAVRPEVLLVMQIAHTGRQTLSEVTGEQVLAPSSARSPYFKSRPQVMDEEQIATVAHQFIAAASRAQRAGFDGVQVHAAHGYLIHQFLSPAMNNRSDGWGTDRFAFLGEVVRGIKSACGTNFPVLVKLSAGDDDPGGMTVELAAGYASALGKFPGTAVEVSYGTMDLALNIFRGGAPLERVFTHNPLFSRRPRWMLSLWRMFLWPRMSRGLHGFTHEYNRRAAREIRKLTDIPLVLVGGIRSLSSIKDIIQSGDADAVALCRPLIREPDLVARFKAEEASRSRCSNCNSCAVMADSPHPLRCYAKEKRT